MSSSPSKQETLGLQLTHLSLTQSVDTLIQMAQRRQKGYVCFANAHMTVEANRDARFAAIVNQASLVLPDGVPLVWAMRVLHYQRQERVAGMDIFPKLLQKAEATQLAVYFYGSTEKVLSAIQNRAKREYPNLIIAGSHSPPFSTQDQETQAANLQEINASGAQLVFVALGCPKQEKWMAQHSTHLHAMLLGVGGAFPVFAQQQQRAPQWMRTIGMEWFFRFLLEPHRLWKRYLVTNSWFLILFVKAFIQKVFKRFSS